MTREIVWNSIELMIDEGLSLIPVRDKNTTKFNAKTPYAEWKEFQKRRASRQELFMEMDKKDTNAVAIVCGEISDNLEVIDIDSKYKEGISAELFNTINKMYPELFESLRIHRTPSGGFHILYRIMDGKPENNQKLASRYKTEIELKEDLNNGLKRPQKTISFLETRGEGGYILAPPSLNYAVHQDVPIPYILKVDRDNLIKICTNFNEVIKESKVFVPKKNQDSIYDESPWNDYNIRADIIPLIESAGFKQTNDRVTNWVHFTRAGKESGISASFNLEKRFLKVLSSNTDFDSTEGVTYSPVDILCRVQFSGDKDKTFRWLIDNGYGRIKKRVEDAIIKKAAIQGNSVPKNLSPDALERFKELRQRMGELMPYGIFWTVDSDDKDTYKINRRAFYDVAVRMGFRLYRGTSIVRINGNIIDKIDEIEFYQIMIDYIHEDNKRLYDEIFNTLDYFLQKSGKFVISRLPWIQENTILADSNKIAYKFFQNCYIKITENNIEALEYEKIENKLIWAESIHNRVWTGIEPKNNLYKEYLENAVGYNDYTKKIIGYLSHDFKDESRNLIIVLTEKVPNPKDGGGSGKNVFGNLLKNTTTVKSVPGSQVKFDERFLQPWNFQKIYFLADIPKRIDWTFLKEMAGGVGMQKKLFVDQYEVQSEDMPKLLINTNYSFEAEDGGVKRRIRPLEFNDFYTINGGVDIVHGKMFPKDFNDEDWQGFDYCIAESIQTFFKSNCKIELIGLSEGGWRKKFDQSYSVYMYEFIKENIDEWMKIGKVSNEQFKTRYLEYMTEFDVPAKFHVSFEKRISAIEDYCDIKGIKTERYNKKINGKSERGRTFGEVENFDEEETQGFDELPAVQNFDEEDSLPF